MRDSNEKCKDCGKILRYDEIEDFGEYCVDCYEKRFCFVESTGE